MWPFKQKSNIDERDRKDLWSIIEGQNAEIEKLRSAISELTSRISRHDNTPSGLVSRLEDLELWRGKIHNLLIETSPASGKEKPTKLGRRVFGGRGFQ